jgi:hypothetical protein
MLRIRPDQMKAFKRVAMSRFECEMVVHGRKFSPGLYALLGDEQFRIAVSRAIDRAGSYGFTNRGPIRLFVELTLLLGSAFDSDPQYPWASSTLNAPDDQMLRAKWLYERIQEYQGKVADGPQTGGQK